MFVLSFSHLLRHHERHQSQLPSFVSMLNSQTTGSYASSSFHYTLMHLSRT
eukprot:UN15716